MKDSLTYEEGQNPSPNINSTERWGEFNLQKHALTARVCFFEYLTLQVAQYTHHRVQVLLQAI